MKNIKKNSVLFSCVLAGLLASAGAWAQAQLPAPVIEPQVDRREVHTPTIKAHDIEISAFKGILSVEDFGANSSSGFRATYHITEDFFFEGMYGKSTVSDQTFFDRAIPIFTKRTVDFKYYYASLGINLFPGEVFIGRNWAMTSGVYLIGGIGNISFADQDHTAYNFGVGVRILPWDWLSLRFDARDHVFESDLLGKNEFKHNFEMTFGLGIYF